MRKTILLLVLCLLASCGTKDINTESQSSNNTIDIVAIEEVSDDLDTFEDPIYEDEDTDEISEIQEEKEVIPEEKSVDFTTLATSYNDSKQTIDMEISYNLDSQGKIEQISVSSTTYDLTSLNNFIQSTVGKNLAETSEITFSELPLASEAFKKAIQSGLN